MSFANTHTPTRSAITGKAKYQLPMRKENGADTYYLTPELQAHFVRLYPTTMNRDMMRLFGIGFSSLQRIKRKLGLEKKMQTIRKKQAQLVKKICEDNGYYDSIRGKSPCQACLDAARRKRATGWHPMLEVKKNKKRYEDMLQKLSSERKELFRKERFRVNWEIGKQTNLYIPYDPYGRKRSLFKYSVKAAGYVPGNAYKKDERWVIYYTPNTRRNAKREEHGNELGFKFEPLTGIEI